MKKSILILLLISPFVGFGQSFVSPINYVNSETNQKRVIAYIQKDVKESYSSIGMDDPSTLRMMEKENLNAFKELIKVTNTALLQEVINTYCEIGMCNYGTILMMYREEAKANNETLEW
tara:strand:- start:1159 stop:1515 length:357 start_codon:yes stop_codon:yes gene_type:complete